MTGPHRNNSFSYKSIHPTIKGVLNSRAQLTNKVQMAMPFVKATTTLYLPDVLGNGNLGFTLGLHAIKEDITAQNIYSDSKGNALIGYTYDGNGQTIPIYTQAITRTDNQLAFFDLGSELYSDTKFSSIPPPGITSVTVGRIKNGVVSSADINFTVPTLPQLEMLHRTFLVPGVGMVVEWGQRFAEYGLPDDGESGFTATAAGGFVREALFPWYDRAKLETILARLATNQIGIDEIMSCYVHPTQGQYQWIFGRVANFSTKMEGDGSFNCSVKIVGPAENSWAYSTRNTVIPAAAVRGGPVCLGDANSVENYFTKTSKGKNFKSLLENVKNKTILPGWENHVQFFAQGNKKSGASDSTEANTDQSGFADSEDAYFISWRFFVNVVLNHPQHGIKGIFKDASLTPEELLRTSVLRPYGGATNLDSAGDIYIDDQYENFVGNNKFLRSIDPSTLIIVNEAAADESTVAMDKAGGVLTTDPGVTYLEREVTAATDETRKFLAVGDFLLSTTKVRQNTGQGSIYNTDKGLLSAGVWLNHKAVVQAMVSANTIAEGLSNLLNRMNSATANFWNLTLDVSEPFNTTETCESTPTYTAIDYTIVDMNYKENAQDAVDAFINKDPVHIFNRYIRSVNGNLVGSDTLECNVDINLPKRLFSQIATLGLVQENEANESGGTAPILGDPNDTLRKMFAITSVARDSSGYSPDITSPIYDRSGLTSSTCGGTVSPPPAGAGDAGRPGAAPANADDANKDPDDLQKEINELDEKLQTAPCNTVCLDQVNRAGSAQESSFNPATLPSELTAAAAAFIPTEEGLPRGGKAYFDPAGQTNLVSIGYGHQIKENEYAQGFIRAGDENIPIIGIRGIDTRMTREQSQKLLQLDIPRYINAAKRPIGDADWNKLSVAQQVALTSYAYNTGSTISLVNAGIKDSLSKNDFNDAARIIRERGIVTTTIDGRRVTVPALVNRRQREASLFAPTAPPTPARPAQTSAGANVDCAPCVRAKVTIDQKRRALNANSERAAATGRVEREFPNLQKIFRYVEIFTDWMVSSIAGTANDNSSNAFGSAPGSLSINAEITLPGINGLRVGELFWIDKIPAFYRALGAFQIINIEDTIGQDGWKTKINAKFNYLGLAWREAVKTKFKINY